MYAGAGIEFSMPGAACIWKGSHFDFVMYYTAEHLAGAETWPECWF